MHSLLTMEALNVRATAKAQAAEDLDCLEFFLCSESDPCDLLEGVLDPATRKSMQRILARGKENL